MQFRQLGRTGLNVSVIGMGGIPVQRIDAQEAVSIIEEAIAQGVNFIDTARAYTDSEIKFGQVLPRYKDKVIAATKSMARTKDEMAQDIDRSLRALRLDYIDLYQIHNVKDEISLKTVLEPGGALEALKEAQLNGKIGYIGITGHIPAVLVKAIGTGEFDTVQFPFNPVETSGSVELIPLTKQLNIGTIAMKPFAGGAITKTILSLRYILEQGFSTVIPGMDTLAQVKENVRAGEQTESLTEDQMSEILAEAATLGETFCRRCEYCQPCPRGIDIPMVFLLNGYWTRYGLKQWAVERYKPLKVKASECIECGECEEKCPYQLPIRKLLRNAVGNLEE